MGTVRGIIGTSFDAPKKLRYNISVVKEPWCSLVNTLPCQGRDREFESRRLRILVLNFQHLSPLGLTPTGIFLCATDSMGNLVGFCAFW